MNLKNKKDIFNYAFLLSKSNEVELAIKIFKKIYLHYPNDYQSLYNIAKLYLEMKDYENAIKYYTYLLTSDPSNIQAKFDLSHIYLINRDLDKGLKLYECRLDFKEYSKILPNKYPKKIKKIKKIKKKRIFIYWEQGFGDTINFIRYIKYLENLSVKIELLIQSPLVSLMKYNFKNITFVENKNYLKNEYDYVFPILSIPYLLKLTSFTPLKKYLDVKKRDVKKFKRENNISFSFVNVGLCWQGEYKNIKDKQRSFNIEDFFGNLSKLLNKKIKFYSLQKDVRVENENITDLGKSFSDFSDTAVAIKSLDLIITVDTAVCHLSAALGVKTFLLLPVSVDWRWGEDLNKSDLYKSIKYFKQVKKGSWAEPFKLIASKLKKIKRPQVY